MKKITLLAALAFSLFSSLRSEAQVSINVQFGAPVVQQSWYDADDDYYYMPDQDCYYNVRRQVYVYPEGGRWVYANYLPARYGGYTWNSSRYYRVRERAPFNRNDYYRRQYRVENNYYGGYRGTSYGRHDNGNHNGWHRDGRGGGNAYQNNNTNYGRGGNGGYQQGQNGGAYQGQQNNGYGRGNNGGSNGYQGQGNGYNGQNNGGTTIHNRR